MTGTAGSAALIPVAPALLVRRRRSVLTVVAMVVLGLGALAIAVGVLLIGGPGSAVVTTVLAAASFPLLIFLCFWLDRYEPEPLRYRVAALGWGAVVAVVIGGGLTAVLVGVTDSPEAVAVAVWAPICEEFGKGLLLFLLLRLRPGQVQGLLDGIVYAVLVGVGFAFVEDILYYLSALGEGGVGGLTITFVLRGVLGPFAHPLFTAATGVGVGIAAAAPRGVLRVAAPGVGYLVAVLLHAIWNGSSVLGGLGGFFLAYTVLMLPLLTGLVVLGVWARRQEGRMLAYALTDCAQMGWLPAGDVRWVATLSERVRARSYARQNVGRPAVTVLGEYQQALTEMAFLHHRVLRGTASPDYQQRMQAIRARASALRPYVVLPPPLVVLSGRLAVSVPGLPPGPTFGLLEPPPGRLGPAGPPAQADSQYSPIPGGPPVGERPGSGWSGPSPPAPPPWPPGPPPGSPRPQ